MLRIGIRIRMDPFHLGFPDPDRIRVAKNQGHSIPTQPEMEVIISEFDENWLDERYIWKN